MECAHGSNTVDVFLFCDTCGAAPIHLVCNNDQVEYTCANCKVEFELENTDLLQAKLKSTFENIDELEKTLKDQLKKTEELTTKLTDLETEKLELKLQNEKNSKKFLDAEAEKKILSERLDLALNGVFCPCKQKFDDDYVQCSNQKVLIFF